MAEMVSVKADQCFKQPNRSAKAAPTWAQAPQSVMLGSTLKGWSNSWSKVKTAQQLPGRKMNEHMQR